MNDYLYRGFVQGPFSTIRHFRIVKINLMTFKDNDIKTYSTQNLIATDEFDLLFMIYLCCII